MTEKKPPLADKGKLIGDFSSLRHGRELLMTENDGRPPNPELVKVLAVLNGEGDARLTNPMKGEPTSTNFEYKAESIAPGFKLKEPGPKK